MPNIKVRSKVASFRRAGLQFTADGEVLNTDDLKPSQIKAIQAEPMLIIEEIKGGGKSTGGGNGTSTVTNTTVTNTNTGTEAIAKLLDGSIDKIVEVITARDAGGAAQVSDDQLAAILDAEQNGKARKTLLVEIENEQLRRLDRSGS